MALRMVPTASTGYPQERLASKAGISLTTSTSHTVTAINDSNPQAPASSDSALPLYGADPHC
jgi:hypothetical protein